MWQAKLKGLLELIDQLKREGLSAEKILDVMIAVIKAMLKP